MKKILTTLLFVAFFYNHTFSQLTISNRCCEKIDICIGFLYGSSWVAKGWWTIQPYEKALVVGSPLTNRYYYFYADSEEYEWKGDTPFCVSYEKFYFYDNSPNCDKSLNLRKYDLDKTTNATIVLTCPCSKDKPNLNAWILEYEFPSGF